MSADTRTVFCASAGFESARQLDPIPAGHPSGRLHGHGFLAKVRCALPAGWARFQGGEVDRLKVELQACVGALDHRLLNDQLTHPSDENLARWVQGRLGCPGRVDVGIQSSARRGADVDAAGRAHLWRRYAFQSAHQLPHVPLGHKCGKMHGHGFEVVVRAAAIDPAGRSGLGHDDLDAIWAPIHFELNYGCLNDLPGLQNPTSELLASWLWARIAPQLPGLSTITVYETGSCGAVFDGERHRIWKEMTLDGALQLKHAPDGNGLRRLHGHTYTLRLHLSAPLDEWLGWAVDFGDVKAAFDPIFQRLDHQPLHKIADLADCDTGSIANWVFEKARQRLPQLDRVDLDETPGCGAIVSSSDAALSGAL
ncbi:MAG: 6-carboxytetrahydropterin synthase [Pseudomonadota bacterium]|nr:6-carboxytetrahydropterin synthase [Pseudomonadota bacterium]